MEVWTHISAPLSVPQEDFDFDAMFRKFKKEETKPVRVGEGGEGGLRGGHVRKFKYETNPVRDVGR